MKVRAARAAAEYFKARDPDTAVTESLIRSLMQRGELPVIEVGTKRLTSIEAIERWVESQLGGVPGE